MLLHYPISRLFTKQRACILIIITSLITGYIETMSRTLEITVLSCEDLRIDRRSVKKNTFVIVRTDPINSRSTSVDTEGGSYPSWTEKLVLEMPMHERFLTLEVHCKTVSGIKMIGSARMPVTDFMGGYLPDNYLNFLSYRLRDKKSEKNGIINVSVKVKVQDYLANNNNNGKRKDYKQLVAGEWVPSTSKPPVLAVPMGRNKNFDGVVTGIPVNWCVNNNVSAF